MNKNGLIYDVDGKPKTSELIVFALQQVLAILSATMLVPSLIGLPTQIPSAILGAGIGTIVYLLFTKFKSPVFLGSSFSFIGPLVCAVAFGYCGILVGSIFAGLVYVVIAIIIHFAGTKWVGKLMPPVIIGPTVALIGLGLAGSAMDSIVSASGVANMSIANLYAPELVEGGETLGIVNSGYNLVALLCGLIAFLTIVICSSQKKFKTMKLIPFIIGIGAGYLAASIFSIIGYTADVDYLKIINWGPIVKTFVNKEGAFAGVTAFLDYPRFALIGAIKEMATGEVGPEIIAANNSASTLTGVGVAEIAIAFIPMALVVFAEHIADHKNLGSIIGRDLVEGEPGLEKTLLGDGVGSIAGTIFGICPNTTYGESVGCVAITKNASIRSIFLAACMCIVLAFLSPIMALLQTIPSCVMGGVCLTLYGFIAVSGLKMFKDIDLGDNKNLFTVSAILISGIGQLAVKIPYQLATDGTVTKFIEVKNIATALILGICVYAIMNAIEKWNAKNAPEEEEEKTPESLVAGAVAPEANFELNKEEASAESTAAKE